MIDSMTKPNGLLNQALGLQREAQQQATDAMSVDPLVRQYKDAQADAAGMRDAAAATIKANAAEKARIRATPLPNAPPPELKELPEKPASQMGDPMRVFGQFLPVLAALGAMTTRNPAVNSMNAATAALTAARQRDQEALERAHQDWMDNLKVTVENNNLLSQKYQNILADRKMTMDEKLANLSMLAAENQDALTQATLADGKLTSLHNLIQVRDAAAKQLLDVQQHVEETNLKRQQLGEEARHNRAQEGKVSMGEAIGPILVKMRTQGPDSLTPAETATLTKYKEMSDAGDPVKAAIAAAMGLKNPAEPQNPTSDKGPGPSVTALPPAAVSRLQEGFNTTFENGETWTLRGGKPVKLSGLGSSD